MCTASAGEETPGAQEHPVKSCFPGPELPVLLSLALASLPGPRGGSAVPEGRGISAETSSLWSPPAKSGICRSFGGWYCSPLPPLIRALLWEGPPRTLEKDDTPEKYHRRGAAAGPWLHPSIHACELEK